MGRKVNIGYIGWFSYDDREFSRPYAVCDINKDKVRDYLQKYPHLKAFSDYRKMADDPKLDVVIISTPNWLHCEMSELSVLRF